MRSFPLFTAAENRRNPHFWPQYFNLDSSTFFRKLQVNFVYFEEILLTVFCSCAILLNYHEAGEKLAVISCQQSVFRDVCTDSEPQNQFSLVGRGIHPVLAGTNLQYGTMSGESVSANLTFSVYPSGYIGASCGASGKPRPTKRTRISAFVRSHAKDGSFFN